MAALETPLSRGVIKPDIGPGWSRMTLTQCAILALATTMIDNADDDFGLFYMPIGAVVVSGYLSVTDMDSSTGLVFDVGDATVEDRLVAAATSGQTGIPIITSLLNTTGHLYKYTARTQVRAFVKTAATTPVAGTLKFSLSYFIDENFVTTAVTPTA